MAITYNYEDIADVVGALRKTGGDLLTKADWLTGRVAEAMTDWDGASATAFKERDARLHSDINGHMNWLDNLSARLQTGADDMYLQDQSGGKGIR
jgi:WXG100 family type VII secretion target